MSIEDFISLIEATGYHAQSYSGRYMYGDQCVGVSCGNVFTLIADLLDSVYQDEINDLIGTIRNAKSNSLGLNMIVYFPQIKYPENRNDDYDEDDD